MLEFFSPVTIHIFTIQWYFLCVPFFYSAADFIHVMAYDLRSYNDGFADVHSPLHARTNEPPDYKHLNVVCKL